jgi:hypothetical protein
MTLHLPNITAIVTTAVLLAFSQPARCQEAGVQDKDEKKQTLVRLLCVSSLADNQKVVLATKDEKGEWKELFETELRSPFVSGWLPAKPGRLFLTVREPEGLKEIAAFNYPAGTRRAVVVLLPVPEKGSYLTQVFDPAGLGFVKGTTLVVNYSSLNGAVALGSLKAVLKPAENKVLKAVPEPNGMFRMVAAYETPEKKTVVCYDRYVPVNEHSRDILFLLPDKTLGIRVFSLAEFGPYE